MSAVTYRGVSYDTERRSYNDLVLQKQRIEKELAKKEAAMANTKHA